MGKYGKKRGIRAPGHCGTGRFLTPVARGEEPGLAEELQHGLAEHAETFSPCGQEPLHSLWAASVDEDGQSQNGQRKEEFKNLQASLRSDLSLPCRRPFPSLSHYLC